jgi:hypothetical protein
MAHQRLKEIVALLATPGKPRTQAKREPTRLNRGARMTTRAG